MKKTYWQCPKCKQAFRETTRTCPYCANACVRVLITLAVLLLSACGPINVSAPITVEPKVPATDTVEEKPVVEEPRSVDLVEEEPVVVEREALVTYTCSATTSGGAQNGIAVFYTLTTYDDLETEVVASVGALSQASSIEDTDQNMLSINTASGHWEVWIDRASLVLSAYYYTALGVRTHWQSWLACTREGL